MVALISRLRSLVHFLRQMKLRFSRQHFLHIFIISLSMVIVTEVIIIMSNIDDLVSPPNYEDFRREHVLLSIIPLEPLYWIKTDNVKENYTPSNVSVWVYGTTVIISALISFASLITVIFLCWNKMLCMNGIVSQKKMELFAKCLYGVLLVVVYPLFMVFVIHTFGECLNPSLQYSELEFTDVRDLPFWDLIQREMQCCGLKGPEDWNQHTSNPPSSCCRTPSCTNKNYYSYYQEGCLFAIENMAKSMFRFSTLSTQYICTLSLVAVVYIIYHSLGFMLSSNMAAFYKMSSSIEQEEDGEENAQSPDLEADESLDETESPDLEAESNDLEAHSLDEFLNEMDILFEDVEQCNGTGNDDISDDVAMLHDLHSDNGANGDTELLVVNEQNNG